jgi:small subunit ribosomal protein S11
MGKKRIIKQSGAEVAGGTRSGKGSKKRLEQGVLHIQATYNNTLVTLSDGDGRSVAASSSGALGFSGAKKGTPFAAAKVGELLGEQAAGMGLKEVDVIIKGVGAGRESALRAFAVRGIQIRSIKDITPIPHNGPRPKKPRRV